MKTYNQSTDLLALAKTQSSSNVPVTFSPQVSFSAAEKAVEADYGVELTGNVPNYLNSSDLG